MAANNVEMLDFTSSNDVDLIVGIDLGTTNCAVSVPQASKYPIELDIGGPNVKTMQSCILWQGGDNFIVGLEAYKKRYLDNAVYSAKRDMGTNVKYNLTYINPNTGEKEYKTLTPVDVSAIILKELKVRTEQLIGKANKCIITVPAYFNQNQIKDTLKAGEQSGWDVVQIIKEPTSASYVYSQLDNISSGSVLVYDLGGGTFDATLINLISTDSIQPKTIKSLKDLYGIDLEKKYGNSLKDGFLCRVISTFGDTHLGGDDVDTYAAQQVLSRYPKLSDISKEDYGKLILSCEEFKKMSMATSMETTIRGNKLTINQSDIEYGYKLVFDKTISLMSSIDISSVNTIVLVGGSTVSPFLRNMLQRQFPNVSICNAIEPYIAVAVGAGCMAKKFMNNEHLTYQDVLPLPIGILVNQERVEHLIKASTSLPHSVSRSYHTQFVNQSALDLEVYQGMSTNPKECVKLGTLSVEDLPKLDKTLSVTVTFVLNSQGCLKLTTTVEGVERDVELNIDNIFSTDKSNEQTSEDYCGLSVDDFVKNTFKTYYNPNSDDSAYILSLYKRREECDDAAEIERLEDIIMFGDDT